MVADELLTPQNQEEALSLAYAHAVAARAGYATAMYDFDRDGVDLRIQAGGAMRPALDLQLKATINLREPQGGYVRFPLPRRNYDHLIADTQTPRLLIVLDLPRDEDDWVTITPESLVMRRRAYWLNLQGLPETENTTSVTVEIPDSHLFDVDNLRMLMEQSRTGAIQ